MIITSPHHYLGVVIASVFLACPLLTSAEELHSYFDGYEDIEAYSPDMEFSSDNSYVLLSKMMHLLHLPKAQEKDLYLTLLNCAGTPTAPAAV